MTNHRFLLASKNKFPRDKPLVRVDSFTDRAIRVRVGGRPGRILGRSNERSRSLVNTLLQWMSEFQSVCIVGAVITTGYPNY